MTIFYVYVLYRPDGRPFYVGKGSGNRWEHHEQDARNNRPRGNPHKIQLIRQIVAAGHKLDKRKIARFDNEADAFAFERTLIKQLGREANGGPLLNLTDGGDGIELTKDIIERRREALRGRIRSPEHSAAISAAKRGKKLKPSEKRNAAAQRRRHTDQTKAKIGAAHLGRVKSPEELANLRAARAREKGIPKGPMSEDAKAKISEGQKRAWAKGTRKISKGADGRFIPRDARVSPDQLTLDLE